jgi:hypothetical protein
VDHAYLLLLSPPTHANTPTQTHKHTITPPHKHRLVLYRLALPGQLPVLTSIKAACLAADLLHPQLALNLDERGAITSAHVSVPAAALPSGDCSASAALQALQVRRCVCVCVGGGGDGEGGCVQRTRKQQRLALRRSHCRACRPPHANLNATAPGAARGRAGARSSGARCRAAASTGGRAAAGHSWQR